MQFRIFLRKIWHDPVWSNVIAGLIVSIISAIPVLIFSAIDKSSLVSIISNSATISIPIWIIYALLFLTVGVIVYIRIRNTPQYFKVRYDWIDASCTYCFVNFKYDGFMSFNEFLENLNDTFDEAGLRDYVLGEDWYLYNVDTSEILGERSFEPIHEFGIKRGTILELHKTNWGQWKKL